MTKKIIDADALKLWLLENIYVGDTVIDQTAYVEKIVFYNDLINKINELATPAPEPQESIFDADGWCWDMGLAPIGKEIILAITSESERGNYASIGIKLDDDEFQYDYESLSMVYAWKLMSTLPKLPTGGNE